MISIRKLAAVEITFLGSRLVIAEFALGVAGPLGLGVLTLVRSQSSAGRLVGAYLMSLAVNCVPLLLHAVQITAVTARIVGNCGRVHRSTTTVCEVQTGLVSAPAAGCGPADFTDRVAPDEHLNRLTDGTDLRSRNDTSALELDLRAALCRSVEVFGLTATQDLDIVVVK